MMPPGSTVTLGRDDVCRREGVCGRDGLAGLGTVVVDDLLDPTELVPFSTLGTGGPLLADSRDPRRRPATQFVAVD
jgi:hypothetical protein